jgi:DNA-binding Lrp family transcriptional regulator
MKEYSYVKKALLRELSENSRTSITVLSKKLKCSRNTVVSNMKALEKEFDICYTLEFNKGKLGLVQNHICSISFGIQPNMQEITEIFKNDDYVQLIAKTEGDFDLLIYISTNSGDAHIRWVLSTISKLLKYRPSIEISLVAKTETGFTPVQSTTIEKLELQNFDDLDKKMLIMLNSNSRLSYRAIAKNLKEDVETIRYRFRKLSKSPLIRRFTLIMRKPPTDYNMAFFIKYEYGPGILRRYEDANEYYLDLESKFNVMNTLQYLALTSGTNLLFGVACFDNEERAIRVVVSAHKEIYKEDNPKIHYAMVKEMIKGNFGIRNMDISKSFSSIKWDQ